MKVCTYSFVLLALFVAASYADEETVPGALDKCPEVDGDYAVHVAHPEDCNKFFSCSAGEAILTACSEGLHFNPVLQVCDWPETAGCTAVAAEEEK